MNPKDYPINHLCSKCNHEYPLELGIDNSGATVVFGRCPKCNTSDHVWIRIPWYTKIIVDGEQIKR